MAIYVDEIYNFLDKIAPFNNAMDFDNCGLLVGNMNDLVKKVILTLDITDKVIEEAISIGANLIISHHPVIFNPIKVLNSNSIPYVLAKNAINAICAHTNLDIADKYGVNYCLAKSLKLINIKPLTIYKRRFYNKIIVFVPKGYETVVLDAIHKAGAGSLENYSECSFASSGEGRFLPNISANPFIGERKKLEKTDEVKLEVICPVNKTENVIKAMLQVHPYEKPAYDIFEDKAISQDISLGLIGELSSAMTDKEFAKFVKINLGCDGIRYTETHNKIKRVAVCSGAGGDYLDFAINKHCDAFVTGEIKHHMILKANSFGIMIVDAGHYKTEDVVFESLKTILNKKFCDVDFVKTAAFTDNIKYM